MVRNSNRFNAFLAFLLAAVRERKRLTTKSLRTALARAQSIRARRSIPRAGDLRSVGAVALAGDTRGNSRMEKGVEMAIGVVVFMLVAAYTVPIAFDQWFSANTGDWPSNIASLWDLVPFFVILSVVLFAVYWGINQTK